LRDGENALLVPAGDPSAIARSVHRLAGDPTLRARLKEGGLATARLHTETIFNEAVLAALTEAARISHGGA
jgi:hypothetical protein